MIGEKSSRKNCSFYRNKRVFITGHTGFKGAWLTAVLHELGAQTTGYPLAPEAGCLFEKIGGERLLNHIIGDVRDVGHMKQALAEVQPELVFHLAAQVPARECFENPHDTYETNIMGTVNLLEAIRCCLSVKSVVIVTTDKVYLNKGDGAAYVETDPLGGDDPYSSSKTCVEYIAEAYKRSYLQAGEHVVGISTARASNVLGGGDHVPSRLIPAILNAISAGRSVELRNPYQTRPWQSVLDALNGYLSLGRLMMQDPYHYSGHWNIGPTLDGIREVVWVMEKIKEHFSDADYVPGAALEVKESQTLGLDSTRAMRDTDWSPQMNCDEAIYDVVNFFKQQTAGVPEAAICKHQIQKFFEIT